MNVLITGGAGFIGSHLVKKLMSKGYQVTVLDNLSEQVHGKNPLSSSALYQSLPVGIKFIHGSVTERKDWLAALQNQDIVVHYAAETGTGQSMYQPVHYTNVNMGGTAILLDILTNTKHTVQKVIIASSRAIYGEGKYFSEEIGIVYPLARKEKDLLQKDFEIKYTGTSKPLQLLATDEESKIHPSSVYGITKQNQEQMVMTVCTAIGVASVALRYQNVYGPGQSLKNPYTGILSIFSTLIQNNQPLTIFEDGKESRDFVYIDDVVDATILSIEKNEANENVYNVGLGVPVDVLSVAKTLCDKYGKWVPINISGNFRVGDIRHNYADLTKIKEHLQYEPKINFETGVKLFADWVKEQPLNTSEYNKSIFELKEKGLYK